MGLLPGALRIVSQEVAVVPVADLLDRLPGEERDDPLVLADHVVHEVADVPVGARRRVRPLVVSDRLDPAAELLDGAAIDLRRDQGLDIQGSWRSMYSTSCISDIHSSSCALIAAGISFASFARASDSL